MKNEEDRAECCRGCVRPSSLSEIRSDASLLPGLLVDTRSNPSPTGRSFTPNQLHAKLGVSVVMEQRDAQRQLHHVLWLASFNQWQAWFLLEFDQALSACS